jgi:hypothetical protein
MPGALGNGEEDSQQKTQYETLERVEVGYHKDDLKL